MKQNEELKERHGYESYIIIIRKDEIATCVAVSLHHQIL